MPDYHVELSITGLEEAQRANEQDIRAVQPRGTLGEAVRAGTIEAHKYAMYVTMVDTGAWKASHRMEFREVGESARGEVYVDPSATNPRSSTPPVVYATIWENRAGRYAAYLRTVQERGDKIAKMMQDIVTGALAP